MNLRFSIPPEVLRQRGAEISQLMMGVLPGSATHIDEGRGILFVTLPQGVHPALATDTVIRALAGIGITAYFMADAPNYVPPIQVGEKKRRGVSLPVFIVSLIAVALAACILTVFTSGALSGAWRLGADQTLGTGDQKGEDYAGKIALVDMIFEEYSLYDTKGERLLDEMLRAYAAATGDTYAAYYTEEEYQEMIAENNAQMVGIGIRAIEDSEHHDILIISVMPDSPALEAGLQPGDRITAIGSGEGKALVFDIGYHAAINRLRGEAGTVAEFTVVRDGQELAFSVVRAAVQTQSVEAHVSESNPTVGVIRIMQFDTSTPTQFKQAMTDMLGSGCNRFVFDVRNNPGGDLKSINAVLSYFLNKDDTILITTQKDGSSTVYQVQANTYTDQYASCSVAEAEIGMYRGYPMAILTNGNTASAAELFTAVLKEYQLAEVFGTTTYGKGVIQSIIHLEQWGYKGAVKLTVGYYSPPSGVNYDGVGIAPDFEVSLSEETAKKNLYLLGESEDAQLLAAINHLQSK
ncbi:MAG: PDZ domain-containing protein [Clostridia bacterium]|nr:PDZ domain-containing protein [Clostridia bacterium]